MWTPSQLAGAVLWSTLITLRWLHAQFLQPSADWMLDVLLGAWEESIRSVIREAFGVATHIANSASGAVLSIFSGSSYFQTVKRTCASEARSGAWRSYWESATGTFNALLEREGLSTNSLSRRSTPSTPLGTRMPAPPEPQPPPSAAPRNGSQQQQAWHRRIVSWWRRRQGAAPSATQDPGGHGQALRQDGRPRRTRGSQGGLASGQPDGEGRKGRGPAGAAAPPERGREMARGSLLFELPSGFAISEGEQRRGLVEEARLAAEVGVTRAFSAARRGIRRLLWLDGSNRLPSDLVASRLESQRTREPERGQSRRGTGSWWRAVVGGRGHAVDGQQAVEDLNVWTASDVILRAGYPLEEHSVATPDGYILQMHRIPRQGARDVVFFQHGVLDTSLGWVANGSVGSQAFAAYDAGFDVWLANARSNAPRMHQDPGRRGARYWHYSSNELGLVDIAAQVDHLHSVKTREILMQRGGGGQGPAREPRAPPAADRAAGTRRAPAEPGSSSGGGGGSGGEEEGGRPAGSGARPVRLWRSASAPVLDTSWQGWDSPGGLLAPVYQLPTTPRAASAGGAVAVAAGELGGARWGALQGERGARGEGGQALMAQEHQIGAAAAAEAGQGNPAGAGGNGGSGSGAAAAFSALLARASTPPASPRPSCTTAASEWGGRERELQERSAAATAAGVLPSLRRTQSAGAMLATAAQDVQRHLGHRRPRSSRMGGAAAAGGPEGGELAAASLASARPESTSPGGPAAAEVAGGAGGGPGCGEGAARSAPMAAPPPLSPISIRHSNGGSGGQRCYPTPSTPSSEGGYGDWGSELGSSGGEGYATPQSAGYDTPRSGYDTPRSVHSGAFSAAGGGREVDVAPYRLQAVGHSLGAACLLMYAVGRRMMGQPHRIRRLVLMSPAGNHTHVPMALRPCKYLLPAVVRLIEAVRPGVGMGLRLPSPLLRFAVFKLGMDLDHIPALHELVRAAARLMLSGDRSQWDRAMLMPHYNTYSMPALSLHCGAHFAQWSRDPNFRLFDYGSKAANRRHYGSDMPPSIADHYYLLGPVLVDLIGGRFDGVISCQDVYLHYLRMKEAGVHVTYREYDFGHMDFTFAVKDEIRHYVLSRLQRPIL